MAEPHLDVFFLSGTMSSCYSTLSACFLIICCPAQRSAASLPVIAASHEGISSTGQVEGPSVSRRRWGRARHGGGPAQAVQYHVS